MLTCAIPTLADDTSSDASTSGTGTTSTTTKPVYQDTDPDGANYLPRRRALVGPHCMVNSLETTVAVGSGTAHLENLVDKDLTNGATFINGVKADVGVAPSCTVRDLSRTYAAGTTAGFVVTLSKSFLQLDIAKGPMMIFFYNNGELVDSKACDQKDGSILELALGKIDKCPYEFTAKSDKEFDEIGLGASGLLSADVIGGMTINYAFVGKNGKYYIDSETSNGISDFKKAFEKEYPETEFTSLDLGQHKKKVHAFSSDLLVNDDGDELINANVEDSRLIGVDAVITIPVPVYVSAYGVDKDNNVIMPFKKGMTVGFELGGTKVLDVLGHIKITPVTISSTSESGEYTFTEGDAQTVGFTILGLSLGVNGNRDVTTTLTQDCNAIKIGPGLSLGIGDTKAYRMFVEFPPEVDGDVNLSVSADRSLCDENQSVTLHSDEKVTWKLTSYPSGADISNIKVTDASDELSCEVSGFVTAGDYVFTATAADGRTATTTVTYGISPVINTAIKPWVNNFTEKGVSYSTDKKQYEKWYGLTSFSLIPKITTNAENLVTPSLDDYASTGGISLASGDMLLGVFRSQAYQYSDDKLTVGFVTRTKWTGLDLSLLDGMSVKLYNQGAPLTTVSSENTHFKVLSADLIGGAQYVTTEYSVEVDKNTPFDAITLWNTGLLGADVSEMNVYYAFVEPSAKAQDYKTSVDKTWQLISNFKTGATIDASKLAVGAGAVSAISTSSNLTHIIDGDLNTHATIAGLANVGNGYTVPVKLGRIFDAGHQVQIITSNQNLLNVKLVDIVKLKAYRNGTEVASKSNWKVLGANVLSGVNKESEIIWTPVDDNKQPVAFDEISITFVNVANVAGDMEIYGIRIANDADGDGIIDANDDQSCNNPYLIDENEDGLNKTHDYKHGILNLRRFMTPNLNNDQKGQWYTICLPVSLTFNQFVSHFGNKAQLAEPVNFEADKPTTIMFDIEEKYGNQTLLEKNKPYIIFLGDNQTDSIHANGSNQAIDTELRNNDENVSSTYQGKGVYIIRGVDYDMSEENGKVAIDDVDCIHNSNKTAPDVTWHGTFIKGTTLPGSFYTFSADGVLTKYTPTNTVDRFRGLRCWMTEKGGSAKGADYDISIFGQESEPTLIQGLFVTPSEETGDVYMVEGLKVKSNATSLEGLPQGVYIWNHKKVMVK